jgi:hypothetical protein
VDEDDCPDELGTADAEDVTVGDELCMLDAVEDESEELRTLEEKIAEDELEEAGDDEAEAEAEAVELEDEETGLAVALDAVMFTSRA